MIRRPPRSTLDRSSAASDVYKRQIEDIPTEVIAQCQGGTMIAEIDTIDLVLYNPDDTCLLYTSPSPRDRTRSRMPSSA